MNSPTTEPPPDPNFELADPVELESPILGVLTHVLDTGGAFELHVGEQQVSGIEETIFRLRHELETSATGCHIESVRVIFVRADPMRVERHVAARVRIERAPDGFMGTVIAIEPGARFEAL